MLTLPLYLLSAFWCSIGWRVSSHVPATVDWADLPYLPHHYVQNLSETVGQRKSFLILVDSVQFYNHRTNSCDTTNIPDPALNAFLGAHYPHIVSHCLMDWIFIFLKNDKHSFLTSAAAIVVHVHKVRIWKISKWIHVTEFGEYIKPIGVTKITDSPLGNLEKDWIKSARMSLVVCYYHTGILGPFWVA